MLEMLNNPIVGMVIIAVIQFFVVFRPISWISTQQEKVKSLEDRISNLERLEEKKHENV